VAATSILAPPETVWAALTDYEHLGSFIPSLVENRCLERRDKGAVLYQVGAQDVAMGVKFRAACTLEIQEHLQGLPRSACTGGGAVGGGASSSSSSSSSSSGLFSRSSSSSSLLRSRSSRSRDEHHHLYPYPSSTLPQQPVHGDITFSLLEGDFEAFKGVWRIQPGVMGPASSWLCYALYVRPHAWLPVGLVQGRISQQISSNLQAVARHSEARHRQQQQQQQL